MVKLGVKLSHLAENSSQESRVNLLKQNTLFKFIGKEKFSSRFFEIYLQVLEFMEKHIYPNERELINILQPLRHTENRWTKHPKIYDDLKQIAKSDGLFNMFLKEVSNLSNLEYAVICETLGRSYSLAPEVFNCSAPDTGNMEVLFRYGTESQKERYLKPLLDGTERSCFAMTEKGVPSSKCYKHPNYNSI